MCARGCDWGYRGWCGLERVEGEQCDGVLAATGSKRPEGVGAGVASAQGIGVIWDELGDQYELDQIFDFLHRLREKAEEICL